MKCHRFRGRQAVEGRDPPLCTNAPLKKRRGKVQNPPARPRCTLQYRSCSPSMARTAEAFFLLTENGARLWYVGAVFLCFSAAV